MVRRTSGSALGRAALRTWAILSEPVLTYRSPDGVPLGLVAMCAFCAALVSGGLWAFGCAYSENSDFPSPGFCTGRLYLPALVASGAVIVAGIAACVLDRAHVLFRASALALLTSGATWLIGFLAGP